MELAEPDALRLPAKAKLVAFALAVIWITGPTYSGDVRAYLIPWLAHVQQAGPIAAFAHPFSNYTPPYLYLLALVAPLTTVMPDLIVLKLLSFGGHLLLAAAFAGLLRALEYRHPWHGALLMAIAPSLLLNPLVLVQCDALWAAALVAALTAAIKRRHRAMLVWCGLAIGIKLQAVFAAPFFLALLLARSVPVRLWVFAPLGFFATLLPAWAAGWPFGDLLTIYLRQTGFYDSVALNAPNLWMIVQALPGTRYLVPIATVSALAAASAYILHFRTRLAQAGPVALVQAACLCAMILPGLLPRMHERYFFLSDVLTIALALVVPSARRPAILAQIGSTLSVWAFLTGLSVLAIVGAVAMMCATWLLLRPYLLRPEHGAWRTHIAPPGDVVRQL